jgi:hypothetical protein
MIEGHKKSRPDQLFCRARYTDPHDTLCTEFVMRANVWLVALYLVVGLGGPVVGQAPDDPVRLLVRRLDLEKYKATIKGLTAFGDRRQGTDRNRAAVDWIEAQLESYGCTPTERIKYDYQPPAQPRGGRGGRGASGLAQGGGRPRGERAPTGVNTDPNAQKDPALHELDSQPTTPGPREEVYCTKVGTTRPDEMYLVGGHMDGHGWGEAANDDGSGTALVMEVARVLSSPDVQTERSIRFILWNNEETGSQGARAYIAQRADLQGREDPPGSRRYPEPKWLGMIQHDMMLFDHGMPRADGTVSREQRPEADVNVEFQVNSKMAAGSQGLAWAFEVANEKYATDYHATVGSHMTNTDSGPFQDLVPVISLRENERGTQIGNGWDPQWHQPTDVYATYSDKDFRLGLNAAETTLGALATLTGATLKAQSQNAAPDNPLVGRVGDTGFIQLRSESFRQLDARRQALAYWLTRASIAIDPIIYDQLSRYGVREKRLLEEIVGHPSGIASATFAKIRSYALLFWANRGNHNDQTSQKFVPTFTFDELEQAALTAQAGGAFKAPYADLPALGAPADLRRELGELRASLFDPAFEPTTTAKTPPAGQDIISASSNTFYRGVTLQDLKGFRDQHPLNSRVVKDAAVAIREEVYRAGTPDGRVPPGLYAVYLKKANEYLERARAVADPAQAQVIGDLIRYYQTGDPQDWLRFGADWVRNDASVDFANGFIEVYRDARGAKGSSQSFVSVTDRPVTDAMTKLAQNAAYFEQKAPWDPKYKKESFQPPVVKAVEVLIETGDFHVTTVGDNLPNENEIHERYGTKNFLFLGSSHAVSAAGSKKVLDEFAASPEEAQREDKYGEQSDDLLTAMHEVIGHGSGKLTDRVKGGAEPYLKEYFSTLEEGRADLMALWNVWDPKLKELGLVTDQETVARAMYDGAARVALTQLRRIPRGTTIEEDHARDRQLIANFVRDKTGAIEQFERGGKTYVRVKDYQKMREGVGMLLGELMRIKAEGDYAAIKALVDTYGVRFDPALRDQVVARYKALDLPTYWAGVNPELTAEIDRSGNAASIRLSYPRDPVRQYLDYGRMYGAR